MAGMAPIHVMGAGSIGSLFAFYLARTSIPVRLILRTPTSVESFTRLANVLTLSLPSDSDPHDPSRRVTLHAETPTSSSEPISRLLVATKASDAARALASVQHRLEPGAVVVAMQNGVLAVLEECDAVVRGVGGEVARAAEGGKVTGQAEARRPVLLGGIVQHGVYRKADFHYVHAGGSAENWIGEIGRDGLASSSYTASPSVRALLDDLAKAPELKVRTAPPDEMRNRAVAKLACNASLNTLTALLRCRNGVLLSSPACLSLISSVSHEVGAAFGVDPAKLEQVALSITQATGGNWSSMAADVRVGRATEIDYLNGHVVRTARARGLSAPTCDALVQLVKATGEVGAVGGGKWE
ncbi:2-dehydropantoate 2-reductase [Gonapodya prolifera JEL478]|uniref:2-dehydropantoate 2-reductase n=1 Tax=Gonapodya prolifera (strain JEL478) TaxID=1344416 RepID=A0A139ASR3_GONPJ|nr:2-dehydropantoate 2-reductase [Gonapodya prolifera JEL478]|eukprot:KXS19694.1 2-dehydropantoate 2-reductase [Gonapodya prolifera JEL478]